MSAAASNVVAVLDGSFDEREIELSLPAGASMRVVDFDQGVERVLAALDGEAPDLMVIGCAGYSEGALELIERTREGGSNYAVVVMQVGTPNGYMQKVFQAGADDLITLPQPRTATMFALEKALARRRTPSAPVGHGALICIVGPKGGTGKTLTACNLTVALAQAGARAVVVDVDLQFGDVGISLGLAPERTLYDLAVSGGSLDDDKVGSFLVRHASGAGALLAPTRPDQARAIKVEFLGQVFASLRARHDFVIVDTPPAFSPEVIASIDAASDLLVVGMLDALSLKDTKIGLETLALMGHDPSTVRLVLNRADTSVGITHEDVEKILGRRPDVFVPSDRAVPRAITEGLPIVIADERSGPARAFKGLAKLYLEDRDALYAGHQVPPGDAGKRQEEAAPGTRRPLLFGRRR